MLNYLDWELSPEQRMIQGVVRERGEKGRPAERYHADELEESE